MSANYDKKMNHRLMESTTVVPMAKIPVSSQVNSNLSKGATSATMPQVPRKYAATSGKMAKIPSPQPLREVVTPGTTSSSMPKIPPMADVETRGATSSLMPKIPPETGGSGKK